MEQLIYRIQKAQVETHTALHLAKEKKPTDKIKHHQLIMNLEYAHEIIKRSADLVKEAFKNNNNN